jgi:hypothetical protein
MWYDVPIWTLFFASGCIYFNSATICRTSEGEQSQNLNFYNYYSDLII